MPESDQKNSDNVNVQHEAVLHIGTEKTGSTSIQDFMFRNWRRLRKTNVMFPLTCGLVSHHRLLLYTKAQPDANFLRLSKVDADELSIEKFKSQFLLDHFAEVKQFHSSCTTKSTVVYSSEHFQSRVKEISDIVRIKNLLDAMYDKVTIIVYLRRQDSLALSAYNTAVQGGLDSPFSFPDVKPSAFYFNYQELTSRWASVFGEENINVRLFTKESLYNENVVDDFCREVGIDKQLPGMVVPEKSNKHLCNSALQMLMQFNKTYKDEPTINGEAIHTIRKKLIDKLQLMTDDLGKPLPSRSAALAFYSKFEASNIEVFNQYTKGCGFDTDFDHYPEISNTNPAPPEPSKLHAIVEEILVEGKVPVAEKTGSPT